MRTISLPLQQLLVQVLVGFLLFFNVGCNDNTSEDYITIDPETQEDSWVAFIEDLSFESIILAENKRELQDALQQATEGDLIFLQETTGNDAQNLQSVEGATYALAGFENEAITIKRNTKSGSAEENTAGKSSTTASGSCRILEVNRAALSGDIAHYQILVRMGNGPFDVVRIHRVVKETRRYRPVRTEGNVFMIHGSSQDFDDIFLRPGVSTPDAQNSSPFYLATNNIDVWGIDLGWTMVPLETTDFSGFEGWGTTKDTGHVLKSMAIARLVRGLTRQGFGRMNLLGFSYGAALTYNAAIGEAAQHRILRDIKGIIPTDFVLLAEQADDPSAAGTCSMGQMAATAHANGEYQNSNGAAFMAVAQAAFTDPDGPSSFAPGLTNAQFAIAAAAGPQPNGPDWHFLAGEFEGQLPVGLAFTEAERWLNLLASLAPHMPTFIAAEGFTSACPENRQNTIEDLNKIQVPLLYIGAAGGYGQDGVFTTSLTSSTDISAQIVTKFPNGPRILDYGHADLFMARDAAQLVWDPLKNWLMSH